MENHKLCMYNLTCSCERKQKTVVNFILDSSGSMEVCRDATISGFNEYIHSLKHDHDNSYEFSLTLFDTNVKTIMRSVSIGEVKPLNKDNYQTDGGTALYDAVCSTIKGIKEQDGVKHLVIIMTDGQENSSRDYNQNDMRKLIKELEATEKWKFVYLGANQDSYHNATQYGFSSVNTTNFNTTAAGMETAFFAMSVNTSAYASGTNNKGAFFSKEDQNKLEKTK